MANAPDVLTIEEVAARLGVSPKTVYRYAGDGSMPVIRLGRRIVVPRPAYDAWLRGQRPQSSADEAPS